MNELLQQAMSALMLAFFTAAGMKLKSWIDKAKKRQCDVSAANEKIRVINEFLGIEPEELKSMDDVFKAIRKIQDQLKINGGNGK